MSPVVTICTASLTFNSSTLCPHRPYLCVLCGSENKQRLFPYTALTDWFVQARRSVFTARYELDLYITFLCILLFTVYIFVPVDKATSLIKCYFWNILLNAVIRNINLVVSSGEAQRFQSGRNGFLQFLCISKFTGLTKAQAVSNRPVTSQDIFLCQVSALVISGGQSGNAVCFPLSSLVVPPQFHSTGSLYSSLPLYYSHDGQRRSLQTSQQRSATGEHQLQKCFHVVSFRLQALHI